MAQNSQRRQRAPVNKVTTSFRVSDRLWAALQRLLPKHKNTHRFGGGKPRTPDRQCADAIFYVLRTGCQWAALDATDLCPHSTAHERFQQWVAAGVFLKLWQVGVEQFEELKGIDWRWLSMDGAMSKAPLGGEKNRRQPHRSRQTGGQAQPAETEAHGVPLGLVVAGAHRPDMQLLAPTLYSLMVHRPEPTAAHPQGLCLDKGYDYEEVRATLAVFGFTAYIRARGEEAHALKRQAGVKARRWVVERAHSWLTRFRRIFIRWEKKADNYLGFLHFACALMAFRAAGLFG